MNLDGWVLRYPQPAHIVVNERARLPIRPVLHRPDCYHLTVRDDLTMRAYPLVENPLVLHAAISNASLLDYLFDAERVHTLYRRYGFCEHCLITRATSRVARQQRRQRQLPMF